MLKKLLKYEFMATGRVMWVIYVAMLALSVVANFAFKLLDGTTVELQPIRALLMMGIAAWVISLIIGGVATTVLMVKRFRDNLLTDEGYLMFTLPGSVHHLVIAKLIAAAVWLVVTVGVIALCVIIATIGEGVTVDIRTMFGFMFYGNMTALNALNSVTIIFEVLVLMLLGAAVSCLQFYSAMSIGHGFANHKVLWSVVFYFIQQTALQILTTLLVVTPVSYVENMTDPTRLWNLTAVQGWHLGVLVICALEIIVGAVFYILTVVNLQKRLNLA